MSVLKKNLANVKIIVGWRIVLREAYGVKKSVPADMRPVPTEAEA